MKIIFLLEYSIKISYYKNGMHCNYWLFASCDLRQRSVLLCNLVLVWKDIQPVLLYRRIKATISRIVVRNRATVKLSSLNSFILFLDQDRIYFDSCPITLLQLNIVHSRIVSRLFLFILLYFSGSLTGQMPVKPDDNDDDYNNIQDIFDLSIHWYIGIHQPKNNTGNNQHK